MVGISVGNEKNERDGARRRSNVLRYDAYDDIRPRSSGAGQFDDMAPSRCGLRGGTIRRARGDGRC
jgi:hypothetical protein